MDLNTAMPRTELICRWKIDDQKLAEQKQISKSTWLDFRFKLKQFNIKVYSWIKFTEFSLTHLRSSFEISN